MAALLPSNKDSALGNSPVVVALKQSLTLLDRLIAERGNLRTQLTQLSQNVSSFAFDSFLFSRSLLLY